MYHPTAGHWALCEVIETVAGEPYADAIHRLVTEPLGLPRLLGIPLDEQDGIAEVVAVGEPATGLSACYVTNGLDQHLLREQRRNVAIADAMASVAVPASD